MKQKPVEQFEGMLRHTPKIILRCAIAFVIFSIFAPFSWWYLLCAVSGGFCFFCLLLIIWKDKNDRIFLRVLPLVLCFQIQEWAAKHFLMETTQSLASWLSSFQFISLGLICGLLFLIVFQHQIRAYLLKPNKA